MAKHFLCFTEPEEDDSMKVHSDKRNKNQSMDAETYSTYNVDALTMIIRDKNIGGYQIINPKSFNKAANDGRAAPCNSNCLCGAAVQQRPEARCSHQLHPWKIPSKTGGGGSDGIITVAKNEP